MNKPQQTWIIAILIAVSFLILKPYLFGNLEKDIQNRIIELKTLGEIEQKLSIPKTVLLVKQLEGYFTKDVIVKVQDQEKQRQSIGFLKLKDGILLGSKYVKKSKVDIRFTGFQKISSESVSINFEAYAEGLDSFNTRFLELFILDVQLELIDDQWLISEASILRETP